LVDDSIEGMVTHEVGHFISYGDMNKEFSEISKGEDWKGYASKLSGYANASFGEYVAESFTAYFNGETDKLQPEMVKIFDSLRR
jgi:predicted SprT family Zn-dependent metalloprotease